MNPSPIAAVATRPLAGMFLVFHSAAGEARGTTIHESGWLRSVDRHATCMRPVFLEKNSHSTIESVDFFASQGRAMFVVQYGGIDRPRRSAGRLHVVRSTDGDSCRNRSAARNGNRKRTRVRVACGGDIRPRGLGHQPIHGHLGLSVVGRESFPPVVHLPACECRVRQRHFSRGPGLLAALTARDTSVVWMSAREHQAIRATRPDGLAIRRAASLRQGPPERPAAGGSAHPPSPRTRLRTG